MDFEKELKKKDDEIRELRKKLDEAQDANHAKEVFLSNMSHDIRTPMNAIIGMTAIAKKYIDEKPRVQDALGRIETAGEHLLDLLNDVLDMSRINAGKMKLSHEPFSLSDLLHDTVSIIKPQMDQKHHMWKLETGSIEVEQLYGDVLRLRQIYVNIISNAVKYTPDGGNILVSVSEKVKDGRCTLVFECTDNGMGMSEEFLKKLYEPFERAGNSTFSKIDGTGLGMSIVKNLVQAMGGEISVKSRLGEGTQVCIETPLDYETLKLDTGSLENRRLLIIENDPEIRERYERYLGEAGLDFTLAGSGPEALSLLKEVDFGGKGYDAAVLGRSLENDEDAIELAGYLHKSFPDLALVLASDIDWESVEYRAGRNGIVAFIPLPFFRKSLINALGRVFQRDGSSAAASGAPDMSGRHVLLVEDNLVNAMIATEILGSTNALVDTAENGSVAVQKFLSSAPGFYSVIFMDIQMPVMDGFAATREIRKSGRPDSLSIPIYAMTANTFAEDIARTKEAGMNGHIAKPIDINTVMHVLANLPR